MATIKEAAEHVCMTERRFYQYVEKGIIAKRQRGAYDLDEVRREYIDYLRQLSSRIGPGAAVDQDERQRLYRAQADEKEIQVAILQRELIPEFEIADALNVAVTNMKVRLLAIPARLAPIISPNKPAKVQQMIREHITHALDELSQVKVSEAPSSKEQSPEAG